MNRVNNIIFGFFFVAVALLSCGDTTSTEGETSTTTLATEMDSVSYALGINIGENVKTSGFEDLNVDALAKGFDEVYNGTATMTNEEAGNIVNAYMMGAADRKANEAKLAGETFLQENGTKDGVVTTASGLQYMVVTEGTGANPVATDVVEVHYHGTLIDGTVFDSSVDRGQPATFPLNGVIAGWTEGLQYMKEGGKTIFYIPSNLAYGDQGAGQMIGPGATLVFEVDLLKIVQQ
ncbi:MAG: FKBP-type peptidyl-prolyl cis-trans isomerase [Chitinophagales bacterium]